MLRMRANRMRAHASRSQSGCSAEHARARLSSARVSFSRTAIARAQPIERRYRPHVAPQQGIGRPRPARCPGGTRPLTGHPAEQPNHQCSSRIPAPGPIARTTSQVAEQPASQPNSRTTSWRAEPHLDGPDAWIAPPPLSCAARCAAERKSPRRGFVLTTSRDASRG